jgi:hypothetical protein
MKFILSIFLMLQIILSSTSLKVSMHYCLGELSDIAIFSVAEVCNFEKYFGTPKKEGFNLKNKSCCGSNQVLINGQNPETTIKQEKVELAATGIRIETSTQSNLISDLQSITHSHKDPFLIEPPIFLRVQSFRL